MQTDQSSKFMMVDFNPDGSVEAMHRESFNLGFLGNQSIKRASEILFEEQTQTWGIWVCFYTASGERTDHPPVDNAKGFASYDDARTMEVEWFEHAQRASVAPMSPEGLAFLRDLRKNYDSRQRIA